jgi:hypothetical protein
MGCGGSKNEVPNEEPQEEKNEHKKPIPTVSSDELAAIKAKIAAGPKENPYKEPTFKARYQEARLPGQERVRHQVRRVSASNRPDAHASPAEGEFSPLQH